jgi:polyisoprenoid-binding protein YceI
VLAPRPLVRDQDVFDDEDAGPTGEPLTPSIGVGSRTARVDGWGVVMALAPGRHSVGPATGSLRVKTYREGVAAKVGHDLVMEVGSWEATVTTAPGDVAIELHADSTSLRVLTGERGVKPLTDRDRDEIRKNIDEKILRRLPIEFRSTAVRPSGDELAVEGDLTLAGSPRPVSARLTLGADGQLTGTIPVVQSQWGIKPYRGLMGALKVRDDVEILIDARLPAG